MTYRARIVVGGMVQGVGFRYFALRKATELSLKGYVRNLPDGGVESEVEGPEGLIKDYAKALRIGPSFSKVTKCDIEWLPFQNKYSEFRITH